MENIFLSATESAALPIRTLTLEDLQRAKKELEKEWKPIEFIYDIEYLKEKDDTEKLLEFSGIKMLTESIRRRLSPGFEVDPFSGMKMPLTFDSCKDNMREAILSRLAYDKGSLMYPPDFGVKIIDVALEPMFTKSQNLSYLVEGIRPKKKSKRNESSSATSKSQELIKLVIGIKNPK